MKLKDVLLIIGVCAMFSAYSQEEEGLKEGRMMLHLGVGSQNFSELNSALTTNGYPELNDIGGDWGFSLWISKERLNFLYDLGAHSRKAGSGNTTNYEAGDFTMSFGYSIIKGSHFSLVPYLGLGLEYGQLELVVNEDPAVTTVAGYISDVPRSQKMDMWGLLGSTGVYAIYDFSSKAEDSRFSLGIHGGYTPRLTKQQWRSAGDQKLDGLSIPGGVSVQLVVGVAFL